MTWTHVTVVLKHRTILPTILHSPYNNEPNGTWLENIAVPPNRNFLVADMMTAGLWEIAPSTQSVPSSIRLIHHFDGAEDVDGIAELSPDTYAVIASNSVWKINLGSHDDPPSLVRFANIPARFLNSMATLDEGR